MEVRIRMKCPGCGAEVMDGSKNCPKCGRELSLGTRTAGETEHLAKETGSAFVKLGKGAKGLVTGGKKGEKGSEQSAEGEKKS